MGCALNFLPLYRSFMKSLGALYTETYTLISLYNYLHLAFLEIYLTTIRIYCFVPILYDMGAYAKVHPPTK